MNQKHQKTPLTIDLLRQSFMQVDQFILSKLASAGNRTRAARVAGEHSTTEPPMLAHHSRAWPWFGFRFTFPLDLVSMVSNWSSTGPHFLVGRNSSVGRALDWRSKGPWFNPGFRHSRNTRRSTTFSPGLNHLPAWNSNFCIKPMWRHIYTCPKLLKIGPVNVWWRKHVLPLNWWFHCEYLLIVFSCELRHQVARFFSLNDGRIRTRSIVRDTPLFLE